MLLSVCPKESVEISSLKERSENIKRSKMVRRYIHDDDAVFK